MKALKDLRLRWRQLLEVHREFADLVRKERRLLFIAGLALVGEISMQLVGAWPLRYLVDGLLLPDDSASLMFVPDGYPTANPWTYVGIVCSVLLVATVLTTTLGYFRQVWAATAGQRMILRLRKRLYGHLQRLSLNFHRDSRHGDLIARITGDIPALRDILSETLIDLVGRLALALTTLTLLFLMDALLATVAVVTLTTVLSLSLLFGRKIARVARRQRQKEGIIAHTAGEALSSVALIKAYGAEELLLDRFARQNRSSMRRGLEGTRLQAGLSRYVEICFGVGTAVVLAFGVMRVFEANALSAGTLLVFLSYVKSLHKPLRKLSRASSKIGKASACGARILEILNIEPDEVDAPDATEAPRLTGNVEFRDVAFTHDNGPAVLTGVDLSIAAGDRIALVGPNGAGKTTLLHLLLRLYEPRSGEVLFDGVPSNRYTIASIRRQISLALQETHLFGITIRENLRFAAPDASDVAMIKALDTAGASFFADLPDGLDTELAEAGKNLSGGERRKIALAAAILRPSAILVMDEPTTHIDAAAREDLVSRFDELTRGRTVIVVTHDAELLPRMDRIVHLESGRIVEVGTHATLSSTSDDYRGLLSQPADAPVDAPGGVA